MGSDLQSQSVGGIAGGFDVFRRHFEFAGFSHGLGVQNAAGNHQLNEIRLVLGNFADEHSGFLR